MKITMLCNCGFSLDCGTSTILVDAPNQPRTFFEGLGDAAFDAMMARTPPYDNLCGLFFSHKHSDHFDRRRVRTLCEGREDLTLFVPNGVTPAGGTLTAGDFTVRYFAMPHSGDEFKTVCHYALLISVGDKNFYFSGDSVWDLAKHRENLAFCRPDAAFWNPNYLSFEEGRNCLSLAEKNYICHIPTEEEDRLGIRRKCLSSWARFGAELPNVTLLRDYPTTIEL